MSAPDLNLELIKEISPCVFEIPIGFVPGMKVPGYFYGTDSMAELAFQEVRDWQENPKTGFPSLVQIANVATLPGISKASYGMPDMHSGYGFSIGGVAAFDTSDPDAIISPGGVGYDINCGVRCITTGLTASEVEPMVKALIYNIYSTVPCGVGGTRRQFITDQDLQNIMHEGAKWAVDHGYGVSSDLENCEEGGRVSYAKPELVSKRAVARGLGQIGTLGSGNHYVEIQAIDQLFDEKAAATMGLVPGQVVVTIHTGSRSLGYQVAEDFIKEVQESDQSDGLLDRQLSSAPFASEAGQRYFHSMGAAANYAWCNRQVITHYVRKAFREIFPDKELKLDLIYDVAHNIAKLERHVVDGQEREFIVHRKGATRAFGPSREEIPLKYREIGQPVLVGGSMGTASYILVGTDSNCAFGSTCHGAGRTMSRSKAEREITQAHVAENLESKGIQFRAANKKTMIEEAPEAYKDIEAVALTCEQVGLSKRVARLLPMGVVKG